jgi:hypothetical protein
MREMTAVLLFMCEGGGSASKDLDNVFCTACGKQVNPWKTGSVRKHKRLRVLMCKVRLKLSVGLLFAWSCHLICT